MKHARVVREYVGVAAEARHQRLRKSYVRTGRPGFFGRGSNQGGVPEKLKDQTGRHHAARGQTWSPTLKHVRDAGRAQTSQRGQRRIRHQRVTDIGAVVVAAGVEQKSDSEEQQKI